MRESRVFINFFKNNLKTIFIIGAVLSLLAAFLAESVPDRWKVVSLYQFEYTDENINQRVIVTDQAVTLLRSSQLQEELKIPQNVKATIYKSGPLAISMTTESSTKEAAQFAISSYNRYIEANFPVRVVGSGNLELVSRNTLIAAAIGFIVGALLGVFVSLVKLYLKNF